MTVEGEVVKSLLEYLTAKGHTIWRNNSGAIRRRGRMVRFGKVGSPDLIGHTRNGNAVYVEAKRPGGKRSPEASRVRGQGHRLPLHLRSGGKR